MRKVEHSRQRGSIVALLLLFIVVLLLVGGAGCWWYARRHAPSTMPITVSMTSVCNSLTLSKGSSDGTAGVIYWHAVLTNTGSHACTLTGYPAAFMLDAHGVSIGAESNSLYAPSTIVLAANGGTAHTVIGLPDAGNFEPGTIVCTEAATSKLRLYVPGIAAPVEGIFGQSGCQGFTATALQTGV